MSSAWKAAADVLAADLRALFRERLSSVVAYGPSVEDGGAGEPVTCLALVTSLGADDLDACARQMTGWKRQGLATPLIMPAAEFLRSLDAFPLEYSEIIRTHVRVFGDDPFAQASVAPDDLRRACETQVKSHLLHLREGYMATAARPQAVASLVAESAPAFTALLRNVARLHGVSTTDRPDATLQGGRLAGLPDGPVRAMLALERREQQGTVDGSRIFPEYLAAVEQLAKFVDSWRQ